MDRPLFKYAPDKLWKGPAVRTAGPFSLSPRTFDPLILSLSTRPPQQRLRRCRCGGWKDEGTARPGIGCSKTVVTDRCQNTGQNLAGFNLG